MQIESYLLPHHERWPLLIYRQALVEVTAERARTHLEKHGWKRIWVDGIYAFSHFHSNTHEVLVICEGEAEVEFGNRKKVEVGKGDVIILPAGVAHQRITSSPDFLVVGGYPFDLEYDMCKKIDDARQKRIDAVILPQQDPIFGKGGPLFDHWS